MKGPLCYWQVSEGQWEDVSLWSSQLPKVLSLNEMQESLLVVCPHNQVRNWALIMQYLFCWWCFLVLWGFLVRFFFFFSVVSICHVKEMLRIARNSMLSKLLLIRLALMEDHWTFLSQKSSSASSLASAVLMSAGPSLLLIFSITVITQTCYFLRSFQPPKTFPISSLGNFSRGDHQRAKPDHKHLSSLWLCPAAQKAVGFRTSLAAP